MKCTLHVSLIAGLVLAGGECLAGSACPEHRAAAEDSLAVPAAAHTAGTDMRTALEVVLELEEAAAVVQPVFGVVAAAA